MMYASLPCSCWRAPSQSKPNKPYILLYPISAKLILYPSFLLSFFPSFFAFLFTIVFRLFPKPKVIALFQEKFGRRPLPKDTPEFSSVLEGALEKNGLPPDFLGGGADSAGGAAAAVAAAAVCATAAAEVSPVCAVLGGILGQEVGDREGVMISYVCVCRPRVSWLEKMHPVEREGGAGIVNTTRYTQHPMFFLRRRKARVINAARETAVENFGKLWYVVCQRRGRFMQW